MLLAKTAYPEHTPTYSISNIDRRIEKTSDDIIVVNATSLRQQIN